MPLLSRWAIRIALLYLVAGWTTGGLMLLQKAWGTIPMAFSLLQIHGGLLLFGWILQLAIAVAYWILPTFGGRTRRGREWAAVTSVILLNAGVLSLVATTPTGAVPPRAATTLFCLSVAAFAWHAWPRVKAFGNP
jgi:hypothetical protein